MTEAGLKEDNENNRAEWRKKLISYTFDPRWLEKPGMTKTKTITHLEKVKRKGLELRTGLLKAYLQSGLPKMTTAMPKVVTEAKAAPYALEWSTSSKDSAPSFVFTRGSSLLPGIPHCPITNSWSYRMANRDSNLPIDRRPTSAFRSR